MDVFLAVAVVLFLLSQLGRLAGKVGPDGGPPDGRFPGGRPKMYFPEEQIAEKINSTLPAADRRDAFIPVRDEADVPADGSQTVAATPLPAEPGPEISPQDLVRGIILSELIGPPPARRKRRSS